MIPLLLLGALFVGGAVVLVAFWEEIKKWMANVWETLPDSVKKNLQGVKAFVEKIAKTVSNIINYYSYNKKTQKWTETSVSREVDPSEIPKDILAKMQGKSKVDISDEFKEQLELVAS